jgi:hypothetical protein
MVTGGLFIETLLFAPVQWPLPAINHTQEDINQQLPAGPIMLWPPFTALAPQYFELLAVLLERPVGIYSPAGVTLSGEIIWDGPVDGTIRVDILADGENGHTNQRVVHAFTLQQAGPFSEDIEIDLGTVELVAFIDREGDGPTPGEPVGQSEKFRVALRDIADVEVVLNATERETIDHMDATSRANRRSMAGNRHPEDLPTAVGHQSPAQWIISGGRAGARTLILITTDETNNDEELTNFNNNRSDLLISDGTCIDENLCWHSLTFRALGPTGRPTNNRQQPTRRGNQQRQTGTRNR